MVYIYVLSLENKKYYVGKTTNPKFRLAQHFESYGSAWTRKYKPLEIVKIIPNCDSLDEDKYTQKYMNKYGIDNVRGGSFTKIKLDSDTIKFLTQKKRGTTDKCFECGKNGHFANKCPTTKQHNIQCAICSKLFKSERHFEAHKCIVNKIPSNKHNCNRCGRTGHTEISCYAKIDIDEFNLSEEDDYSEEDDDDNFCHHCGRTGHNASRCYAKIGIDGMRL